MHNFSGMDFIGDVHGQLEVLEKLGEHLGYDIENGWNHPEDRLLVFLGDLIDRGEDSLGVAELVMSLVLNEKAQCLMGNHEYNLVSYAMGLEKRKKSNEATVVDFENRRRRWDPVIHFFRGLPLALEFPELRCIHAVWHLECFHRVVEVLGTQRSVGGSLALKSPFSDDGLVVGLPADAFPPAEDKPHEILIKGFEERAKKAFPDNDGKERKLIRVTWWDESRRDVASGKLNVIGHYWNLPPIAKMHEEFVPPHPSGHPTLRSWQRKLAPDIPEAGFFDVPENVESVCVDYNGVCEAEAGGCAGAFRWPERQVAHVRIPPWES